MGGQSVSQAYVFSAVYLSLLTHSFKASAERMSRVLRAAGGTEAAAAAVEWMLETGVEHLLHGGSAESAHHRVDEELEHGAINGATTQSMQPQVHMTLIILVCVRSSSVWNDNSITFDGTSKRHMTSWPWPVLCVCCSPCSTARAC